MSEYAIQITVKVQYLEDQSLPEKGNYSFAYTMIIKNDSQVPFQVIGRHWTITDAEGVEQEVRGLGVVGQQPFLRPGEAFEYTSWASIPTPDGKMKGNYFCVSEEAEFFAAPIPEFLLTMPRILH
jgi:ApaG protein